MATSAAPALVVKDLFVSYGTTPALTGVNLTLGAGKICGLVGANGAGKSTLMKAIMAIVPAAGSIQVLGTTPAQARKRGLIGYTPQHESVDWDFPISAYEVVMMGRYHRLGGIRRPGKEDRKVVSAALDAVELGSLAHRPIGELSGGQKKRVFVARAIAQAPQLLLLDEPFGGVDKRSEATIIAALQDLANQGVTLLVSTHDLAALPQLASEVVLLNRVVTYHGPVAQGLEPHRLLEGFGVHLPGSGER